MIVKNLLVVGVVAGFASAAAAEDSKGNWSIGGRVRVDNVQSTSESTPSSGSKTTTKSSSVGLNRAQFSLNGSRGSDSLSLTYYADSNELYSAVVSHKVNEMVTAHFGKMKVLAQSVENSYDAIDQYMWSWMSMHAPANSVGARVDFGFGDHNVSVQAVEGVSGFLGEEEDIAGGGTQTPTATFSKSGGLTTALQYRGQVNNMIKPVVTYTQVRTTSTKGTLDRMIGDDSALNYGNGYMTQLGLGAQISASGAAIDLEYDSGTMHKQKDVAGDKDVTMSSLVAQVKYPVGATSPFLKISSDAAKLGQDKGVGDKTGMNLALGVEHSLDASCRLHAVYTSESTTTKAGSGKDAKDSEVGFNIGVTASM